MKNGHMILGQRYTNAIRNEAGTSNKMLNLSKRLYDFKENNLREIHEALIGLLYTGYDISNMRDVEELAKYVDVKKTHRKLLDVTREDIELYHRLFVARFGK